MNQAITTTLCLTDRRDMLLDSKDIEALRVEKLMFWSLKSANALEWWQAHCQEFKKLSRLSKKYLCVPATSVPSERLFSKAGELVSARSLIT